MKKFIKLLFSVNPVSITLGSIFLVVVSFLIGIPILDLIELKTYDLRFLSRGHLEPSPAVVMAVIDEKSLDTEGRWPWPRSKMASLVEILSQDGAKVIGFDIGFLEPDENSHLKFINELDQRIETLRINDNKLTDFINDSKKKADNDQILANAISRSSATVILGYFFQTSKSSLNHQVDQREIAQQLERISSSKYPLIIYEDKDMNMSPFLNAIAPEGNLQIFTDATPYSGYFNMIPDQDGVVRWMPLIIACGDDLFPPLALLCVWHYLDRPQLMVKVAIYGVEGIEMGERFIPTDEMGEILINYLGPPRTFPHYSISDILHGKLAQGTFKDKIVVVGSTALGIYDVRNTPFSPVYPGLEVHATIIDNILKQNSLNRPQWARIYDLLAIIALGLLIGIALPRLSALKGLLFASGLFILHIMIARWLFVHSSVWLNIVYPLLVLIIAYTSLTVYHYITEERERKKIRGAFGRYVSDTVIHQMLKHPEQLELGGEERTITVLFTDLASFTSYSEYLTPHAMIGLLSEYFEEMTKQVFAQEGTLKEYVGDELMAIFGAPLEQQDHAKRACAAALAMQKRLRTLREIWTAMDRPALTARTGVNSGTMLVGNLGSSYRFSYGALGDQVNLGSRLEGLNKMYGTEILIGENTARLVEGSFLLREVDLVRVKGRKQSVHIYELLASTGDPLPKERDQALNYYTAGLEAYRRQLWEEAIGHFEQVQALWSEDQASRVMAERCRMYHMTPPEGAWDGVFEPLTK